MTHHETKETFVFSENNFFPASAVNSFKLIRCELAPIAVSIDLNLLMYVLDYLFWIMDVVGT